MKRERGRERERKEWEVQNHAATSSFMELAAMLKSATPILTPHPLQSHCQPTPPMLKPTPRLSSSSPESSYNRGRFSAEEEAGSSVSAATIGEKFFWLKQGLSLWFSAATKERRFSAETESPLSGFCRDEREKISGRNVVLSFSFLAATIGEREDCFRQNQKDLLLAGSAETEDSGGLFWLNRPVWV